MAPADPLDLADRLFAAIEAGDVDAVRQLYAPGVRIWHNHDGVSQTGEENLRVLAWLARHLPGLRYEHVRRSATADGFVQQHVLRARTPGGVEVEVPACIVATCADERIVRLDEYLDSVHVARVRAAVTHDDR